MQPPHFATELSVDDCCASPTLAGSPRATPAFRPDATPCIRRGLAPVVPGALYLGAVRDIARLVAPSDDAHALVEETDADEADEPPPFAGSAAVVARARRTWLSSAPPVHINALVSVAAGVGAAQLPAAARASVAAGRVAFMHLPLEDALATRLEDAVGPFAAFVDAQRARGRAVAVFCREGRSRSVACAIAYLMRREGLGFDAALAAVRRARPQADPNLSFVLQLSAMQSGHAAATPRRYLQPSMSDDEASLGATSLQASPQVASVGDASTQTHALWPAFPPLDIDGMEALRASSPRGAFGGERTLSGRGRGPPLPAGSNNSAWRPHASCSSRGGLGSGHASFRGDVMSNAPSPALRGIDMPAAMAELDYSGYAAARAESSGGATHDGQPAGSFQSFAHAEFSTGPQRAFGHETGCDESGDDSDGLDLVLELPAATTAVEPGP